jgi:tetratricopeptide (TPR) repeat protein
VFYVYGLIYDATDRADRAMSAHYQAVQLDPKHLGAMTNLGAHYLRKKMFAEATLVFEKLTGELGSKSAVVWTNLGSSYRGRAAEFPAGSPNRDAFLREAETAFKRAMSSDRGYPNTYYNLGLLYLDADPFPGASGPMDTLQRLGQARTYFEEYGRSRGADRDLMNERIKDVDKLIKREKKRQKRDSAGEDW